MPKKSKVNTDQSMNVYNRQLNGDYCVDYDGDDEITIPIVGTRSLASIVDPATLPSYTTMDYNPKKGTFKERRVQADPCETIIGSAQDAQMKLRHHMRTGHERECHSQPKSLGGMVGMASPRKRGY